MVIPKKTNTNQGIPLPKPNKGSKKNARKKRPSREPTTVPADSKKDPKTGLIYKMIPKTTRDENGDPKLNDPAFDAQNMNNEASKYLPHLRVAPDKEEQKRLRAKREADALKREREYQEINQSNEEVDTES